MNASGSTLLWRLFALDPETLNPVERSLLRTALIIVLAVVGWTFLDVQRFAGVDLRNRVVGARVMLAGFDPYAFEWESGMPEEWLDPVYDPKAHRLTVSPPTLLLYAVVAPLPYRLVRLASYLAEWSAMLVSLALLVRLLTHQRHRAIFLLVATVFIIASDTWRLHVERGQVYAFQLLALSLALHLGRAGRVDSISAGVALGVLGLMRPNLLIFAPGLLLLRQWRCAGSLMTTVLMGGIATAAMLPASGWRNYFDVGEQYYRAVQEPEGITDRPRATTESWVEGVDFQQQLHYAESSSFAVLWRTLHERTDVPMIDLSRVSKLAMLGLAAALVALLWRRDRTTGFVLLVTLGLDTEFFLPHRWGYADVLLLAPLAIALPHLMRHPGTLGAVTLGLLGGLLGQLFFGLYVATLMRAWVVMGSLTWLAITSEPEA